MRLSRIAHPFARVGDSAWLAIAVVVYAIQEFGISRLTLDGAQADLRRFLFFATTLIVAGAALHFRRYWGAWLIAAGILLNLAPMAGHGGLMPVAYETIRDSGAFPEVTEATIGQQVTNSKDIVLWREDIRFEALSDRYFLDIPGYGANIFSLGDFVVFAGVVLAAGQVIAGLVIPRREPDSHQPGTVVRTQPPPANR